MSELSSPLSRKLYASTSCVDAGKKPGALTPPSRFIRAVAFAKIARPTASGEEKTYEMFRILDNFNVPLGAAEGEGEAWTLRRVG